MAERRAAILAALGCAILSGALATSARAASLNEKRLRCFRAAHDGTWREPLAVFPGRRFEKMGIYLLDANNVYFSRPEDGDWALGKSGVSSRKLEIPWSPGHGVGMARSIQVLIKAAGGPKALGLLLRPIPLEGDEGEEPVPLKLPRAEGVPLSEELDRELERAMDWEIGARASGYESGRALADELMDRSSAITRFAAGLEECEGIAGLSGVVGKARARLAAIAEGGAGAAAAKPRVGLGGSP